MLACQYAPILALHFARNILLKRERGACSTILHFLGHGGGITYCEVASDGRRFMQSLVAEDSFQHILRVLNTNVDGKQKIVYAMTAIKGLGRRFSNLVCKKAEVDLRKR